MKPLDAKSLGEICEALRISDSDGVDEADGAEEGRGRGKLKRKATTILSPVTEVAPKLVKSGKMELSSLI